MASRRLAALTLWCLLAAPAAARVLTAEENALVARMRALSPHNDAPVVALLNLLQTENLTEEQFIARFSDTLKRQVKPEEGGWTPTYGEARSNRPLEPDIVTQLSDIGAQAFEVARRPPSDANQPVNPAFEQARPGRTRPNDGEPPKLGASLGERVAATVASGANSPRLFVAVARSARERGDQEAALQGYSQAVAAGDRSPDTLSAFGAAAYETGDYGQAREAALEALKSSPAHAGALAVLRLTQGRVNDGSAALRVAS
ncbi:MAG: hypothetical protein SF051_11005, partial [Elusimicrobiota bacterium]|nr:hypothetical protein [Elusimicrobiota bacterium]